MTCTDVYYPGGEDSNYDQYDEILEFRPDTEEWSLAGRMVQARGNHAVSTINREDVYLYCNHNWTIFYEAIYVIHYFPNIYAK